MITEYENLCMKPCTSCHNCLLPQCKNFVSYSNKDIQYECTNCTLFNCIKCNAAHTGLSCDKYQLKIATKRNEVCLVSFCLDIVSHQLIRFILFIDLNSIENTQYYYFQYHFSLLTIILTNKI